MSNNDPLEKVIEQKVCDYAKQLGCLAYKFTSPARRSVPDRLFVMPEGKGVFFIEFKRKGKVPSPAQEVEIAKIRKQKIRCFVVDNVTSGCCLVADLMHGVLVDHGHTFTAGYNVVQLGRVPSDDMKNLDHY